MNLHSIRLHRLNMPFVTPFRTSFGQIDYRVALLVQVLSEDGEGWGECAAMQLPMYSAEYVDGAIDVIERVMAPSLLDKPDLTATSVAHTLQWVRGHRMAKSALEAAVLDLELRTLGLSMRSYLGGTRSSVATGVSVGITDSIQELVDAVGSYIDQGYARIKLKIKPGWDVEPVRAIRETYGEDLVLQVDANAAYSLADAQHLARLDEFRLTLLEQPLDEDDIHGHATLAQHIETPICLDESITSARAASAAIATRACQIVNIKPGRVGGYLEARRIHDVCAAAGVAVWCGGMMETGVGRAANTALASMPNFVLPGDISATSRYYEQDITEPFVLKDGCVDVPTGSGTGVTVNKDAVEALRVSHLELTR